LRDLVSGDVHTIVDHGLRLEIGPYQVRWIRGE
jgi:hypothetical protein